MALTSLTGLVPLRQYYQEFTSSGTWTCPTGTSLVEAVLVGGGGGGGTVHSSITGYHGAAGGGGGGEVKKVSIPVTAGTTYTVTVGAGGSGSTTGQTSPVSGGNGGDTSFGLTRTLANGHYYNHEHALALQSLANGTTNSTAYVQPGGWFGKYLSSGYTIASPPAYTVSNSSNNQIATYVSTISSGVFYSLGTNAPAGWNGYSYRTLIPTTSAYADLNNWVPVTASTQYTASAYNITSAQTSTAIRIEWYQSYQGTFISASSSSTNANTTQAVRQQTVTATSPANATYALVRYQAETGATFSGDCNWINQQFEQGASATSYKGPFTSETWTQTGIYNVTAGAVASGGGGGSSTDPNAYSSVPGIGGGSASSTTTAANFTIGGAGSGMGSPVVPPFVRINYTGASSNGITGLDHQIPPAHPITGRGGSGTVWTLSGITTPYITAGSASYGVDGYGGGGAGGIATNTGLSPSAIAPTYVTGKAGTGGFALAAGYAVSGSYAVANSGCGGGGAAVSQVNTVNNPSRGGNGGSGKVIISYWGY